MLHRIIDRIAKYIKNPTNKDNVMLSLFLSIVLLSSSLTFILGYGIRSVDLRYALEVERAKFSTLALITLKQQDILISRELPTALPHPVQDISQIEDFILEQCKK